ncbi:MAG: VTT domain-containing protein [Alphaproteobacteria bacterium]|nr:VTT domain-containing protein [Alphaproteobacteria bacterium]
MMDEAHSALLLLGSNPWAIAVAIVLATFVLEDVAIVGAALLAASGVIAVPLALAALVFGIFAGDLGLYGVGAAARTQGWARRHVGEARMARGQRWLDRRLIPTLIGARFVPGFRLPTYAASGFLRVPFLTFAATTAGASVVWTVLVFTLVTMFGVAALNHLGSWTWLVGGALLALAFFSPKLVQSQSSEGGQ